MINELKALAEKKGDRLEVVPIERVKQLERDLEKFQSETELNGFQKFILNKLIYFKGIPEKMRSVIIVAVSRPAYANITFQRGDKEYNLFGTVSMPGRARTYVMDAVKKAGYSIEPEGRLPYKRLAVQSGLAEYGKNNITYVNGLGSYYGLTAFSTDMPCEKDNWREPVVSAACENCEICSNNCPTGAIKKDRFLLSNNRCLSAWNEGMQDFPDWMPSTAHHTPFDCLKCQVHCPMNADNHNIINIEFAEAETERILAGAPYKDVSKELKAKINTLGLDSWPSIPRNLRVLFDLMDKGYKPSL